MSIAGRVHHEAAGARRAGGGRLWPGARVTLRRPRRLRGTPAIARRRVAGGWEVEIRTALGTPVHLVLPARALRPARPSSPDPVDEH